MTALPRRLLAATVIAVLYFAPVTAVSAQSAPTQHSGAQVYLLRGLLNIFSLGMDFLAEKLKAQGFQPAVSTWESGSLIADSIVKARAAGARPPIILIGHSLGANTTLEISRILGEHNIPVDLVVTFDPTVPGIASANIRRFINFFSRGGGQKIEPGPGFKGELDNLDLSADGGVTHGNIDEMDRYHQFVIARMLAITGGSPPKAQGRR